VDMERFSHFGTKKGPILGDPPTPF